MEYVFVGDFENCPVRGTSKVNRDRMERRSSMGGGTRKKLADISNLPQETEPLSQIENLKSSSLATNLHIEQLHKENTMLMKALADRNKIIELSGTELQKLRISVQKLQLQNQQLAQANSQMLAELNLGKDKRKVLDHELGCKNGLLHAIKLELEPKVKMVRCDEVMESFRANKGDNKPCTTNKRRQSRKPSLVASTSKPVERKMKVDNEIERHSLRRSKRFISEEPDQPEALSEEPETSEAVSKDSELDLASTTLEPLRALENKRPCLRRQSDEAESTEHLIEIYDGKATEAAIKADHKRSSLRRQSMRFKSEEPVAIESASEEIEPPLVTSHTTDVELLESEQDKSHCMKKESARAKSVKCEPTEDLFEMDSTRFPVGPLSDDPERKSLPTSSVKEEDGERNSLDRGKVPEHARLSMGRPLRQAAVKVQSYKELTLKVKMRRPE